MVRSTDRPVMTKIIDLGRKATKQTKTKKIVNRVFIFFALSQYNMPSLHIHNFYIFRDMNLKFSGRTCL